MHGEKLMRMLAPKPTERIVAFAIAEEGDVTWDRLRRDEMVLKNEADSCPIEGCKHTFGIGTVYHFYPLTAMR